MNGFHMRSCTMFRRLTAPWLCLAKIVECFGRNFPDTDISGILSHSIGPFLMEAGLTSHPFPF